jgi:hypothetical protein
MHYLARMLDWDGVLTLAKKGNHAAPRTVRKTDDATLCGPGEHCDYVRNDALNRRYCAPN